jgi:hypothetical protein
MKSKSPVILNGNLCISTCLKGQIQLPKGEKTMEVVAEHALSDKWVGNQTISSITMQGLYYCLFCIILTPATNDSQ